jgi:imidazolonepropionase-like amidohydrolase
MRYRVVQKLTPLLLALLSSCSDGPRSPAQEAPLTVILGARLIDGSGSAPWEDSVIVVEGTRLRAVGSRAETPVPKGSRIIDAAGQTAIPGLIELHAHYFRDRPSLERSFRNQLAWGVTTSRSIGVDPDVNLAVIADARAGRIPAPRLYTAGLGFTHPNGHPVAHPVVRRPETPGEARQGVAELAARKVDFIKIWVESKNGSLPKITPEVQRAIVEDGSRLHIPVVAHIFDEADARRLIELGVRDFLHTVRDRDIDASFLKLCRDHDVSFIPTLAVAQSGWFFAENSGLLADSRLRSAFAPADLAELEKPATRRTMLNDPALASLKDEYARAERFVKTLSQAGVAVGVGSDSGTARVPPGWGTHHELTLLVAAGLTPLEALTAATGSAARILAGPGASFGTLAAGKAADLVLLDASPLDDITNTRTIARVMQAGRWIEP